MSAAGKGVSTARFGESREPAEGDQFVTVASALSRARAAPAQHARS
jgi:hypothetical protein